MAVPPCKSYKEQDRREGGGGGGGVGGVRVPVPGILDGPQRKVTYERLSKVTAPLYPRSFPMNRCGLGVESVWFYKGEAYQVVFLYWERCFCFYQNQSQCNLRTIVDE